MAAPKGNQFWKLRSKHGRDKLFASPDLLWEAACEYFQWCDDNPWIKNDAIRGGEAAGEIISIPTTRPYTLSGLNVYLNAGVNYWTQFREGVKENKDFSLVVTRIEEIIFTQKFEGAAVGAFNALLIARELGIAEKTQASLNITGLDDLKSKGTQILRADDTDTGIS